ncbi:hypothetical protein FOZ62_000606 [Perkinsus olseni]|nr:hypothetical protein FOZ62_000606 [Perkinsus olseni]
MNSAEVVVLREQLGLAQEEAQKARKAVKRLPAAEEELTLLRHASREFQEALASRSEECSRLRAEVSLTKKKMSKMVARNAELDAAHEKSQTLAADQRMLQEKLAYALAVIRRRDAECQALRRMASRIQAGMLHYTEESLSALGETNRRIQEVSEDINGDRVQVGFPNAQLFDAVVDYSLAKVEVERLQEAKARMAARGGSGVKSLDNSIRRALTECEEAEGALSMAVLRADREEIRSLSRSLLASLLASKKARECPPRVVQTIRATVARIWVEFITDWLTGPASFHVMFRVGRVLRKQTLLGKHQRRVHGAYVESSFHHGDIDPLKPKFQWVAEPFKPKNMPTISPAAQPHTSLRAITHEDEEGKGRFHIIDAAGLSIGRLSQFIVRLLTGKYRVDYRCMDNNRSDSVIVVNAILARFVGHTWDTKIYRSWRTRKHDPLGAKIVTAKHLMFHNPALPLNLCIRRMLPSTLVRTVMTRRLYIYPGAIHPHWGIPQVVVPRPTPPPVSDPVFTVTRPLNDTSITVRERRATVARMRLLQTAQSNRRRKEATSKRKADLKAAAAQA